MNSSPSNENILARGLRNRHNNNTKANTNNSDSANNSKRSKNISELGGPEPVIKSLPLRIPFSLLMFYSFLILFSRMIGVFLMPIQDCDETFNYWEPTHFILYGRGLQTWEYSPEYGLRSYLYIWLYGSWGVLLKLIGVERIFGKVGIFFGLRVLIGLFEALTQIYFIKTIHKHFGSVVSFLSLLFISLSPGMIHSSISFLPSSFSMVLLIIVYNFWIKNTKFYLKYIIGCLVVAGFIGWPFLGALALPIMFEVLIVYRSHLIIPILYSLAFLIITIGPSIIVDFLYYERLVFAIGNIIKYNSGFNSGSGQQLYGEEPASYYLLNLFLNFNVLSILMCLAPVCALIGILFNVSPSSLSSPVKCHTSILKLFSSFSVWMALMFWMPHKEERFLYVVYPLIPLFSSYTLVFLSHLCSNGFGIQISFFKYIFKFIAFILQPISVTIFIFFSLSRVASLILNYRAPLLIFTIFHSVINSHFNILNRGDNNSLESFQTSSLNNGIINSLFDMTHYSKLIVGEEYFKERDINICVGKEWYRFHSHFFLPSTRQHIFRLQFIDQGFGGLLPSHYDERGRGAAVVTGPHNNMNRVEKSRYVGLDSCHYIMDLEVGETPVDYEKLQYNWKDSKCVSWQKIISFPFLDVENSKSSFDRAFLIPGRGYKNAFKDYVLFKRYFKYHYTCNTTMSNM